MTTMQTRCQSQKQALKRAKKTKTTKFKKQEARKMLIWTNNIARDRETFSEFANSQGFGGIASFIKSYKRALNMQTSELIQNIAMLETLKKYHFFLAAGEEKTILNSKPINKTFNRFYQIMDALVDMEISMLAQDDGNLLVTAYSFEKHATISISIFGYIENQKCLIGNNLKEIAKEIS